MGTLLFCLALNLAVGFYLHLWQPITNLVKAFQLQRQIRAFRAAGLLAVAAMILIVVPTVHAQSVTPMPRSDGDDALVAKWVVDQHQGGITGVESIDKAILYVWNNCGKLMILFGLLAAASILNSKLKASNECHGDVLRREAAERWEEENGDEMHNPFNSPEGMQPASQYVPVRQRHPAVR